jgi:hypothetical protein
MANEMKVVDGGVHEFLSKDLATGKVSNDGDGVVLEYPNSFNKGKGHTLTSVYLRSSTNLSEEEFRRIFVEGSVVEDPYQYAATINGAD